MRSSHPRRKVAVAGRAAGEGEGGLVDVTSPFAANGEPAVALEPGQRARDDPAVASDAQTVVGGVHAFETRWRPRQDSNLRPAA